MALDLKEKIQEIVEKVRKDESLQKGLKEDPVKTVEGLIGVDLPEDQLNQVVDGVNAIVLPFDMSEIPVDRIAKGLKKFRYKPHEDRWGEIFVESESSWEAEREETVTVEAIVKYLDLELDKVFEAGQEHECSRQRGEELEQKHLVKIVF